MKPKIAKPKRVPVNLNLNVDLRDSGIRLAQEQCRSFSSLVEFLLKREMEGLGLLPKAA